MYNICDQVQIITRRILQICLFFLNVGDAGEFSHRRQKLQCAPLTDFLQDNFMWHFMQSLTVESTKRRRWLSIRSPHATDFKSARCFLKGIV